MIQLGKRHRFTFKFIRLYIYIGNPQEGRSLWIFTRDLGRLIFHLLVVEKSTMFSAESAERREDRPPQPYLFRLFQKSAENLL